MIPYVNYTTNTQESQVFKLRHTIDFFTERQRRQMIAALPFDHLVDIQDTVDISV